MYCQALVAADQEDQRNFLRIHRKKLRDATDPFEIPESRFMELYRLNRTSATILLNELKPNTFIPQPIRMCAALHFFATGSFHRDIGQDFFLPFCCLPKCTRSSWHLRKQTNVEMD